MAPTPIKAPPKVPKAMTLAQSTVGKKTRAKSNAPTRGVSKKTTSATKKAKATQLELPQSFRAAKKHSSQSSTNPKKTVLPRLETRRSKSTATCSDFPITKVPLECDLVAKREKELDFQKQEIARQNKARDRRADQITNRGFFFKGRWIKPVVNNPFIFKIEDGMEGTADNPIEIPEERPSSHIASEEDTITRVDTAMISNGDLSTCARVEAVEKDNDADQPSRHRGRGPDITSSFDRRYPHIAEMIENRMLDEQDDAGSLDDFVTADEWSDGEMEVAH